jgi:hypothetical protein
MEEKSVVILGVPNFAVKPPDHEFSWKSLNRQLMCPMVRTRGKSTVSIDFSFCSG